MTPETKALVLRELRDGRDECATHLMFDEAKRDDAKCKAVRDKYEDRALCRRHTLDSYKAAIAEVEAL